jgi:1-phosphofructokinase family hexose kinase
MILTITINPVIDKTAVFKNGFKLNSDHRADKIICSAGGKGINVSRVINRLGGDTVCCAVLGSNNNRFFEAELARERIKCRFVYVPGDTRTNLTMLDEKRHISTRVLEPGQQVDKPVIEKIRRVILDSAGSNCKYAVFSGALLPGMPKTFYRELVDALSKRNIRLVLDSSGDALVYGLSPVLYMIKPNLQEAESVLNTKLDTVTKIKQGINCLLSCGVKIVAISNGDKGVFAGNRINDKVYHVIPPKIRVVNSVGCGDAFLAGVVQAQSKNRSFIDSIKFGVAAGTANVTSYKPGVINRNDVYSFYKKTVVREV